MSCAPQGLLAILALAASALVPARLLQGSVTPASPTTVGGGEVWLELKVDASGRVAEVLTLRDTPPFTALLREDVGGWRFAPASAQGHAVASAVLVAGVFRPPALHDVAAPGQAGQEAAEPSQAVPSPSSLVHPPYPPDRLGSATVLVEVSVGVDGAVKQARLIGEPTAFDDASLDAARRTRFRAAQRGGMPVVSTAVLVFGFREPLTAPGPPPR
jgi:outer membrane biosynthesis protein TonB